MGRRFRDVLTHRIAVLGAGVTIACTSSAESAPDTLAIQRAVLTTLFLDREHSSVVVLLRASRDSAPVLGDSALHLGSDPLAVPDTTSLRLPVPVHTITLAMIDSIFRVHPDGWRAFYRRYERSAGIIELTAPRVSLGADGTALATMMVARSCGEHCRSVWRVSARRSAAGAWRTVDVVPLALPRG